MRRFLQRDPAFDARHVPGAALAHAFRAVYLARRAHARFRGSSGAPEPLEAWRRQSEEDLRHGRQRALGTGAGQRKRRRNILFMTSDQQRYDSLGVNGGRVARTSALDALARSEINFRSAHVQNVVCYAVWLWEQRPDAVRGFVAPT